MLEGLSEIPWAKLGHAYGTAGDVPDLIRALTSPDADVRSGARWQLYGNIFHQGTRYEASAYAVPFLLELLADPGVPERVEILQLLVSVAIGFEEAWLPDGFPVARYREQAAGGAEVLSTSPGEDSEACADWWNSLDGDAESRVMAHFELSAYDAVRAGVPLYRLLLSDSDPAMRITAAYALGWFPEEAAGSVPVLGAAVADENQAVAGTALVSLGLIGADDAGVVSGVIEPALDDSRGTVRCCAAIAAARLCGPRADPRAVAELLVWAGEQDDVPREVPYQDGDLPGYAGEALEQLGDEVEEAAFDVLLSRVPVVSGPDALRVVGEALRIAFPGKRLPKGTPFTALDERQRRLARALADSPATWRWGDLSFGNFSLLVDRYGLPSDHGAMTAYVA